MLVYGAGVGDVSVWEFSGYQPYYVFYDQFVVVVVVVVVVTCDLVQVMDERGSKSTGELLDVCCCCCCCCCCSYV